MGLKKLSFLFGSFCIFFIVSFFVIFQNFRLIPEYKGVRLKDFDPLVVQNLLHDYFKTPKQTRYDYKIVSEYGPVGMGLPKANVIVLEKGMDYDIVQKKGVAIISILEPNRLHVDDYRSKDQVLKGDILFENGNSMIPIFGQRTMETLRRELK